MNVALYSQPNWINKSSFNNSNIPAIYVDSINGNDANNGLSLSAPKLTLASAKTAATAAGIVNFKLKGGSHWREEFDLSSFVAPVVERYGSGLPPVINGADIFTGWTAYTTGGVVNMFQKTVTNVANVSNRLTVYEDGVLLVRVATDAACDALPGSFVDPYSGGTTPANALIRIHPYGSTNATSDGKVREVSIRLANLVGPDDSTFSGIEGRGSWNNNGHIDMVDTTGGVIEQCVSVYGTKHSLGMGSGVMRDCIAVFTDVDTARGEGINPYIAFLDNGAGQTQQWIRCGGLNYAYGALDFYSHGNPTGLDSTIGEQVWQVNEDDSFVRAGDFNSLTAAYYKDVINLPLGLGDISFLQARINKLGSYDSTGQYGPVTLSDSVVLLANRGTATPVNNNVVLTPVGDTTLQRGVFAGMSDLSAFMAYGSSANTVTVNRYIFFGGSRHIDVPVGRTYIGDFNVFYVPDNSYQVVNFQAGYHVTLAGWQASCGQDANSVYLAVADQTAGNANAFWLGVSSNANLGPADGDWRINPHCRVYKAGAVALKDNGPGGLTAFADNTTLITTAGPQNHLDWNEHASVAGPPTMWPIPPQTLAESQVYILAPDAWDFYKPNNIVAPVVTGIPVVAETLTCAPGTWSGSPSSYVYQWMRDGGGIIGATASAYEVQQGDVMTAITCEVRATNANGQSIVAASNSLDIT